MTHRSLITPLFGLLLTTVMHLQPTYARDVAPPPTKPIVDSDPPSNPYAELHTKARAILMEAEEDFIASPPRWMPAAAGCQRVIRLLPKLEAASKNVTPSYRPKMKISKAIDMICISIMELALKKLSPKACKGYWMLRGAFDYFVKRDTTLWKPRLKKLARCMK